MTTPVVTPARAAAPSASWGAGGVPWFVWAAVVAATSAKVGILWDISWHRSIGRDTFWTPAHMAIYLGGVLAGLSCGWVVLKTTLMGTPDERAAAPTVWGVRGPLDGRPHERGFRSEEHTSELQSHSDLVCRLLLEKKKQTQKTKNTQCASHT